MEICGEYFGFHQDEDIYDYLRAHYAHFFPLLRLQAGAAYLPGGMIIHYPLLPARSLLGAGLPHQQAAAGVPTAPPCLPCHYYYILVSCPTTAFFDMIMPNGRSLPTTLTKQRPFPH